MSSALSRVFRTTLGLICCLVGLSASASTVALSSQEQSIVNAIESNQTAAIHLLEKVVNINSGTMNLAGVRHTGEEFAAAYKALGFQTRWIDGQQFNRAGHLSARYGQKGTKILLIGHLDTVFAKDSPMQKFERIDQRYVKGPGITDMKGGDVVMLEALRALKAKGAMDNLQVWVMLMGDEEKRGRPLNLATEELVKAAKWADYALGFEDGDGNPKTAVVSRRGASGWVLKVKGKAAHSSQIFREDIGDGAIFEAARILQTFRRELQSEKFLTFNPGLIVGGTRTSLDSEAATGEAFGKNNVIAQTAEVKGDIRALSPAQLNRVRQKMKKIVSNNLNQTQASISFSDGYPPMAPRESNQQLLKLYSEISQQLGYGKVEPVNPRKAGAADISFAASYVKASMDGLGLMGDGGHTVRETADMDTFVSQTQRAALLMLRLSQVEQ